VKELIETIKNNNLIDRNRRKTWGKQPVTISKRVTAAKFAIQKTGSGITYDLSGTTGGSIYTHNSRSLASMYDVYRQGLRL
jgi:hypothetical protein